MAGTRKLQKKEPEKKVVSILRKYGARKIASFGSYAHAKKARRAIWISLLISPEVKAFLSW